MLELEHRFRVVDVHARLDSDEEAVAVRGRDISPERLEREMHQAGVVRAVVSPGPRPAGEGYLRANNAVARLSVDRPFLAFARLNGPRDASGSLRGRLHNVAARVDSHHTKPGDVEQYAYDDRFHGYTLEPARDGLPTEETLDRLAQVGDPVLVRAGHRYPPSAVAETLLPAGFPVVVTTAAGDPLTRPLIEEALSLLDDHDECYLDTACIRSRDALETAVLEHPDRVLFGSGAPEMHPNVGVMEVLTLDVPEDAMRKVFTRNPERVVEGLAAGDF